MATVITSTQVVTDFGAYYLDAGQNESNIHTKLMEPFGTIESFRVIETEDTVLREANATFSEVLQGFQKLYTPKGGIAFAPSAIPLFNVKVDELFYPDDLKNQWLSFLTSNNLDRTTWPFVRFFIEEYVIKQIKVDLEMKAIFTGVYSAPTPGTPNNAIDTMNGVKKIINDGLTGTTITVIPTGTPSTDPKIWCAQVEAFCAAIPELYWGAKMNLNMSRVLALRYATGRKLLYNMYYAQAGDLNKVENFDDITVKGYASMTGSAKIWMTVPSNAVLGMKGGSNKDIVEVEKIDRQVKVYTDFWIGAGFIDYSLIYTNDQALAV